ncbi:MAG: hypothetical protein Q7T35_06680 [Nitrosomonas sp.]|nr:hypothetical protein [Nitrosomonas sp.]
MSTDLLVEIATDPNNLRQRSNIQIYGSSLRFNSGLLGMAWAGTLRLLFLTSFSYKRAVTFSITHNDTINKTLAWLDFTVDCSRFTKARSMQAMGKARSLLIGHEQAELVRQRLSSSSGSPDKAARNHP